MLLKIIQKSHAKNYLEIWNGEDPTWAHAPPEDFLNEVTSWVAVNELGRRTSYNGWQLRSTAAVTAFMLRWSPI